MKPTDTTDVGDFLRYVFMGRIIKGVAPHLFESALGEARELLDEDGGAAYVAMAVEKAYPEEYAEYVDEAMRQVHLAESLASVRKVEGQE